MCFVFPIIREWVTMTASHVLAGGLCVILGKDKMTHLEFLQHDELGDVRPYLLQQHLQTVHARWLTTSQVAPRAKVKPLRHPVLNQTAQDLRLGPLLLPLRLLLILNRYHRVPLHVVSAYSCMYRVRKARRAVVRTVAPACSSFTQYKEKKKKHENKYDTSKLRYET